MGHGVPTSDVARRQMPSEHRSASGSHRALQPDLLSAFLNRLTLNGAVTAGRAKSRVPGGLMQLRYCFQPGLTGSFGSKTFAKMPGVPVRANWAIFVSSRICICITAAPPQPKDHVSNGTGNISLG